MWYWGIGSLATLALLGELGLRLTAPGSGTIVTEAWALLHFFTILTNLIIAVVFLNKAVTGRGPGTSWSAALTLWIVIVGAVYWALLYRGFPPSDPKFYTDHAFHTVVPVAVAVWWLVAAPRGRIAYSDAVKWLIFPLGYSVYVLIRGALTGAYPYFFVNVSDLGYLQVLANICGFAALFWVMGSALVLLSRLRGH